jgi:hypothetical protein
MLGQYNVAPNRRDDFVEQGRAVHRIFRWFRFGKHDGVPLQAAAIANGFLALSLYQPIEDTALTPNRLAAALRSFS